MDIVSRLKQFITFLNIPVTQFADSCNIARPTLSQLLNGRNKKVSDEFISKIHDAYPALSIIWLLFGEGEMLFHSKGGEEDINPTSKNDTLGFFDINSSKSVTTVSTDSVGGANIDFAENIPPKKNMPPAGTARGSSTQKEIGRTPAYPADKSSEFQSTQLTRTDLPFDTKNIEFKKPDRNDLSLFPSDNERKEDSQEKNFRAKTNVTDKKDSSHPHRDSHESLFAEAIQSQSEERAKKQIVNIIVYYDDNSFEAFVPRARK